MHPNTLLAPHTFFGNNIRGTQSVRVESFGGNVAPYIIRTLCLPTGAPSRFMSLKLLDSPSEFSVGSYSSLRQPEMWSL